MFGAAAITLVLVVTIYYLENPLANLRLPLPHLAVSLLAIATREQARPDVVK